MLDNNLYIISAFLVFIKERFIIIGSIAILCIVAVYVLFRCQIIYFRNKAYKANSELSKQHELLKVTLSSIGESVISTNEKGMITFVNRTSVETTGYLEQEMIGRHVDEILHIQSEQSSNRVRIPIDEVIYRMEEIMFRGQNHLISKNGDKHLISGSVAPIKADDGTFMGAVIVLVDLTEQKKSEEQMHYISNYDSLTGLPNRTLFLDRLKFALVQAKRSHNICALILFDLDNFKTINDTLGHSFGDLVLKTVGKEIRDSMRDEDTLARFGGDEFVILQTQMKTLDDATKTVNRILEKFQRPWFIEGRNYYITASFGVAFFPNDGQDEHVLIKNAETAMYRSKELGKNKYQLYTQEMNLRVSQRLEMENYLRHAIDKGEFVVYYQPQVDILHGRISGVEALVRWVHPNLGLVPPMDFIPLAEESGLIVQIGEWVLRTACNQSKTWQASGIAPLNIAVNLSARQFLQRDLVESITCVLKETSMDPSMLELEITESTAMHDLSFTIDVLNKLKDRGIGVSLDDFGTGYSSLNYLRKLPINTVKIDKSFVRDITEDSREEAIAKAVISLAHMMKLSVTAEGVETNEQLDFLRNHRCDKVQGFLFSKPLPAEEIGLMLKKSPVLSSI